MKIRIHFEVSEYTISAGDQRQHLDNGLYIYVYFMVYETPYIFSVWQL